MTVSKKKYKIYCVTEGTWIPGISVSDSIPVECPNDPAHEIKVDSLSIDSVVKLDNFEALSAPGSSNDVSEGYYVGSRWVDQITDKSYICVDNSLGVAVWVEVSGSSGGDGVKSGSVQFSYSEEMDYDQYLVSWSDDDTQKNRLRRSGHSNGLRDGDCSPIIIPVDSTITSAMLSMKGGSVSTGSVDPVVNARFEIWNVGWSNEGVKLADVDFPISTGVYPLGTWWDSWDQVAGLTSVVPLSVGVGSGSRLAIKFRQRSGSDVLCTALGTSVVLTWEV